MLPKTVIRKKATALAGRTKHLGLGPSDYSSDFLYIIAYPKEIIKSGEMVQTVLVMREFYV